MKRECWLALVGSCATIPALIIVTGGIQQMILGEPNIWESLLHLNAQSLAIHPLVVLGGLGLAIGLNAIPLFRFQFQPSTDALSATATVKWRLPNLAVFGMSVFLLCALLFYAFGENFKIVPR